jgi:hypothetical protein
MPTREDEQPFSAASTRVERRVERNHVLLRDDRGQARVECPARAVVLVRIRGLFSKALAQAVTAEIEHVLARVRPIDLFIDGRTGVPHVDPEMRPYMGAWTQRWRSALRSQHILPGSKLGIMMLTVANLLTGGSMQIYTSQAPFDAALRLAIRGS